MTENLGTQPAIEVPAEAPLADQDLAEDQTDTRGKRKRAGSPRSKPSEIIREKSVNSYASLFCRKASILASQASVLFVLCIG